MVNDFVFRIIASFFSEAISRNYDVVLEVASFLTITRVCEMMIEVL